MAYGFHFPPQQFASPQFPISSHHLHQEVPANSSQPMSSATLLVRHLPDAVPIDTLSRLFSHYGASAVRPCSGGRLRNCAFVEFNDEASALQAQRQFSGLRFLGKVLSVEQASKHAHDTQHLESEADKHNLSPTVIDNLISRGLHGRSQSGCLPSAEPIAENLGVDYPFPPHLEYSYPPPDGNILTNIVNALIAVPRFYTQVLHLMNKMNIPAPFRMALPTPPLPAAEAPPPPPPPQIVDNLHSINRSSDDESEMESCDEEFDDGSQARRKRIKREVIVGPAIDKDVAHEAVGLKPATLVPKEIPFIKKKNSVLQIKIVPKKVQHEDRVESVPEEPKKPEDLVDDKAFATAEEIERQKLPPEEILSLPKFKNYAAGNPAPVLYIKNLAKDVSVDDIYYIFGSLFGSLEAAKSGFHVRVLQYARQDLLEFMFQHGHYDEASMLFFPLNAIPPPPQPSSLRIVPTSSSPQRPDPLTTNYGTIDDLCELCVGYGAMPVLEEVISARIASAPSQDAAVNQHTEAALARICNYCETHKHFNYFYKFQVIRKDHVAAGLCCIQLFINSSSLEDAVQHLENAKMHFDEGLSARSKGGESTKLITKGTRGRSASEKLTEEGLVKLSARAAIQIEVLKAFNDSEGPQWKHSLFGNPNDPETFRRRCQIAEALAEKNYDLAFRLICEFNMPAVDIYAAVAASLAERKKGSQLTEFFKNIKGMLDDDDWDQVLGAAINVYANKHKERPDRLIDMLMSSHRKVLACVVCGRLKSAFQIASRSGSVADVQYVAHQALHANALPVLDMCRQWLAQYM